MFRRPRTKHGSRRCRQPRHAAISFCFFDLQAAIQTKVSAVHAAPDGNVCPTVWRMRRIISTSIRARFFRAAAKSSRRRLKTGIKSAPAGSCGPHALRCRRTLLFRRCAPSTKMQYDIFDFISGKPLVTLCPKYSTGEGATGCRKFIGAASSPAWHS